MHFFLTGNVQVRLLYFLDYHISEFFPLQKLQLAFLYELAVVAIYNLMQIANPFQVLN